MEDTFSEAREGTALGPADTSPAASSCPSYETSIPCSLRVRESVACPDPWEFWRSIGSPKFVCAPMVDQSELPFRLLCRRYGAQLAYTPMLHSRLFAQDRQYREKNFPVPPAHDRPLFAHFCGNDPHTLLAAVKKLPAGSFDAVDLNLGCPQGIARKGHYGSFLLTDPDLICEIIRALDRGAGVPVTCKLRKVSLSTLDTTLNLVRRIENAGAAGICIHGRSKEEKGQHAGPADWPALAAVKAAVNIPVIGNGGVETREDAERMMEETGVDAVMSAEALLEYPALFHGPMLKNRGKLPELTNGPEFDEEQLMDMDTLVAEYMQIAERYPPLGSQCKAHLFHFLHAGLQIHTDLRAELGKARCMRGYGEICSQMRDRRCASTKASKIGWYRRYRKKSTSPAKIPAKIPVSEDMEGSPVDGREVKRMKKAVEA